MAIAQVLTADNRKASLSSKFRKSIIGLYLLSLLATVPAVYFFTQQQVYAGAHKELSLLVDMVRSVREYVSKDLRPGLLEAGLFHSPGMSSTVTTSLVAGHFRKKQPDYYIKVASDNPLNKLNSPEPLESELLKRYRYGANLQQDGIEETGVIQGKTFLVSARPSVAEAECLRCHGDPASAPEPVRATYGTDHGYSYKIGDVVGVMVVGVPLQDVNSLVLWRALTTSGILTLVFGLIVLTITSMVKRSIIVPVVNITKLATALSKGDLEHKISQDQDASEISDLAGAIERLRRSMVAAMKRVQK